MKMPTSPPPSNNRNWSYSFWKDAWRKKSSDYPLSKPNILCFETGYFGLFVNTSDLTHLKFGTFDDDISYTSALEDTGRSRMEDEGEKNFIDEEFDLRVEMNNHETYRATICKVGTEADNPNSCCHAWLWESGRLVQHYDLIGLKFHDVSNPDKILDCYATLGIVIWPSSMTFTLFLSPPFGTTWKDDVKISWKFREWNVERMLKGPWKGVVKEEDSTNGDKKHVTLTCQVGQKKGSDDANNNNNNGKVEGIDINIGKWLVEFDERYNCSVASIVNPERSFDAGYTDIKNMDSFNLVIKNNNNNNNNSSTKNEEISYIPFQLYLEPPANITGLVPMLWYKTPTSTHHHPSPITMQLSKNWHLSHLRYLRSYALLPISNNDTKTVYQLKITYGFYGALPSASHSNLSLVGYVRDDRNNGRWDQLAIGCWGETICFDVDMSVVDTLITDVRSLMVKNTAKSGKKWSWTNAGWGGDWFHGYAKDEEEGGKVRLYMGGGMKTAYVSHGPCLTEARYSGYYGTDHQVRVQSMVRTLRTDDYARTFFDIKYKFNTNNIIVPSDEEEVECWFFKSGKTPHLRVPLIVLGNATGPLQQIQVPDNLKPGHKILHQHPIKGDGPWWISFPQMDLCPKENDAKGQGWKSLIIPSYKASLGGGDGTFLHTNPSISLTVFKANDDGTSNIDIMLVPPPSVDIIHEGDSVEFEVQWVTLPHCADDYYGPNLEFRKHLNQFPDSWETIYREVKGNYVDLDVEIMKGDGKILSTYPLIIHANYDDDDEKEDIEFKILGGGVGALPIQFRNLVDDGYFLFRIGEDDECVKVKDSKFCQNDYDAENCRYQLTFNIPMDDIQGESTWVLAK